MSSSQRPKPCLSSSSRRMRPTWLSCSRWRSCWQSALLRRQGPLPSGCGSSGSGRKAVSGSSSSSFGVAAPATVAVGAAGAAAAQPVVTVVPCGCPPPAAEPEGGVGPAPSAEQPAEAAPAGGVGSTACRGTHRAQSTQCQGPRRGQVQRHSAAVEVIDLASAGASPVATGRAGRLVQIFFTEHAQRSRWCAAKRGVKGSHWVCGWGDHAATRPCQRLAVACCHISSVIVHSRCYRA